MERFHIKGNATSPGLNLSPNPDGDWVKAADAQATIAALQAQLERQAQENYDLTNENERLASDLNKRTAELERVRGELQSAEAGYFVAERDLQGTNNKYDELRTLIAALPKVEGEIEVVGTTVRWGYGHSSCMDTRVESEAYAALLQHRQGMEG